MRVNTAATEGKLHVGMTAVKMEVDSLYDGLEPNRSTVLEPAVEDAYTIMCPALPGITADTMTCHTNYQATSNGRMVPGRYVDSTPYCTGNLQKQITLV